MYLKKKKKRTKKKRKKYKKKKKKKYSKLAVILLIVFIHQLLCIENTKEQLPDMNFCHPLQETSPASGGLPAPRSPAYRFFFSGYATEL
jgi:hypothetical protein